MAQWWYMQGHSQANPQRHGPVPAETLAELFHSGRIGLDTLVWREGQPQWAPLSDFSAELGLTPTTGSSLPPPLPQNSAVPPSYVRAPQPRFGLTGCMIALVVAAVLAIPVVAILAAVALPAYQDYTLRAKIVGVLPAAAPLKSAMVQHLAEHQRCPDNGDPGFGAPDRYASANVATATVGQFESGRCGIELILRATGSDRIDGKALWLEYQAADASWQCSSEIDDKYLPRQCRG